MSLSTNLFRILPPAFRPNYCPQTWQQFGNDFAAGMRVIMLLDTGTAFYNLGNATPLPENRIYPWIHTDNGRIWIFKNGLWTTPRSVVDPSFRWIWRPASGTPESALWSIDGGDGQDPEVVAPDDYNGTMWLIDHDVDGRFLVGAGEMSGTDKTIAYNEVGGKISYSLSLSNMPEHFHRLTGAGTGKVPLGPDSVLAYVGDDVFGGNRQYGLAKSSDEEAEATYGKSSTIGEGEAFEILPPYRAVYLIKPSARQFYTLPA